jgi:hypothetical protein
MPLYFKILHYFRHNLSQQPYNKQGDPNNNALNLCSERLSVRTSIRKAVILIDILHKFALCLQAHTEMMPQTQSLPSRSLLVCHYHPA